MEAKVAVTPMNGFTRFAGTMEIGGINDIINPVRVNAIAKAAESYYPNLRVIYSESYDNFYIKLLRIIIEFFLKIKALLLYSSKK